MGSLGMEGFKPQAAWGGGTKNFLISTSGSKTGSQNHGYPRDVNGILDEMDDLNGWVTECE